MRTIVFKIIHVSFSWIKMFPIFHGLMRISGLFLGWSSGSIEKVVRPNGNESQFLRSSIPVL